MLKSILVLTTIMAASLAQAQGGLVLGEPSYGGNGCPAGTASVTLSPDQQELSILFDQYIAEAGETTGRQVDRKSCNLTVPVQVPQGYSVAVFRVDYRGFNVISSPSAQTRFSAEYFWAGARGPVVTRIFRGPQIQDFSLTDNIVASALVWTRCGDSINLRANTSATAIAGRDFQQTSMFVDSADVSSGLIYHLQWKRCR